MLQIKRIYEQASPDDGYRILVDRLWPRGVSKEKADLDRWEKEIAPSKDLREEYHHQKITYDQFKEAYSREIEANPAFKDFAALVKDKLVSGNVTLLYGSRDEQDNNAEVLELMLKKQLAPKGEK